MALVAPASTVPAGRAELLTIAPEIVAARIQSRFMIACYPMLIELLSTLNCTLESINCVPAAAMSTYPNVKFLTNAAEEHQQAPDVGRESAFAERWIFAK